MHSEGVGQLSFAVILATKIYLHSVIRTEGHITMLNGSALPPVVRNRLDEEPEIQSAISFMCFYKISKPLDGYRPRNAPFGTP